MEKTTEALHNAPRFSRRVRDLEGSEIFRIGSRAQALRAQGRDIIRLDAGEPDFPTPGAIIDAAKQALDDGYTRYTPIAGLPGLKQAIRNKLQRDNNLHYADDEVMHTCGAKQAIFNACLSLLSPGDEVILPSPCWGTYPAIAQIAGAKVVYAPTCMDEGFVLTPETLSRCITPRTRMLVLNSPNNPTGQVYSREALSALANVLLDHEQVFVLSDDIYEHLRFNGEPYANIVNVSPSLKRRTVLINGVSKAYAMTGWRVGFAAGPADLITEMTELQGQTNAHTAAVSQKAAEAALNSGLNEVHEMVNAFARRAAQVDEGLSGIPAIRSLRAQGSFYCLPDFSAVIQSLDSVADDRAFADWLLDELGIAMVPGSAFGAPGHMRLSFAADSTTLSRGVNRLVDAFAS